jgi:hypothetical protein
MSKHQGNPNSQQPNTRPWASSWIQDINLTFTSFSQFPLNIYYAGVTNKNQTYQMKSFKRKKTSKMNQNQTLFPKFGTPKLGIGLESTTYVMLIGQFYK